MYVLTYMTMNRTIKLKVQLTHADKTALLKTMAVASDIFNSITDYGFKNKTFNKMNIHNATYYPLRKKYPEMPSSLLQGIRDVACESLKGVKLKTQPTANEYSALRYNQRVITIKHNSQNISIASISGRVKARYSLPEYYQKYVEWNIKSSTLNYYRKQDTLYLHVTIEKPTPERNIIPAQVLGIDRGIVNIAVCSNNIFFNSAQIKNVRSKYAYLRSKLQSVGTQSARRKLKRLSGREKRFVTDVNHLVSKGIVAMPYNVFAIEDLNSIRVQKRRKSKSFRRRLNNWSFYQLEQFLRYKSEAQRKQVVLVDSRYTSQKCSMCEHTLKSNRNGATFKCKECGFELHSDLNAARNIANAGISCIGRLPVNQPIVMSEPTTTDRQLQAPHF